MVVLKLPRAVPPLLHHLLARKEAVVEDARVEAHLVARDGVDEGHDELEEGVHEEGHVDDECEAEPLGVVRLDDVEHLARGAEGGVLGFVGEVDEEVEGPGVEGARISRQCERGENEGTNSIPGPIRSIARSSIQTAY